METRAAPFRLLFIGSLAVSGEGAYLDTLDAALRGGADAFLLREKTLGGAALLRLARECRKRTADRGALLLLSDRLDVALACRADGAELPEDSFTPEEARSVLGADRWIGRSVHDREGAIEAEKAGADHLLLGPLFPTPGKKALGVERAASIARSVKIPVVTVGGIDASKIGSLRAAGFRSCAVIRAIAAADPEGAARALRRGLDKVER